MSPSAARALATVCGLGDRLPAPGTTVGSLLATLLFLAATRLPAPLVPVVAVAGLLLLLPLAVTACGAEARRRGVVDPGAVVLDEVVGQWLALSLVLVFRGAPSTVGGVAWCFLLFRAFDVAKPWPIHRLERLPGGWGIVADDLAAGVAAAAAQLLLPALVPALR